MPLLLKSLSVAVLLSAACVVADDAKPEHAKLVEEFDGELDLDWEIQNQDEKRFSLTDRPGELVLKTARGKLGTPQRTKHLNPLNFFLLKRPIKADETFEVTLHVSHFAPSIHWQQVNLIFYQDGGNLTKLNVQRSDDDKSDMVGFFQQTDGKRQKFVHETIEIDGPFWLRMKRVDGQNSVSYSNDGDQFKDLGTFEWTPADSDAPLRLGLAAFSGTTPTVTEIDAVIESFHVEFTAAQ